MPAFDDKEIFMAARNAAPAAGPGPEAAETTASSSRRWLILAVISVAQLMIVLDLTVMNLALPSAQRALGFTNADRQWIVTAYALSFGSLLLFCGRLADLIGRKVTFLAGLAGFAAASAVGGASGSFTMLVAARACQGAFAALLGHLDDEETQVLPTIRRYLTVEAYQWCEKEAWRRSALCDRMFTMPWLVRHAQPDERGRLLAAFGWQSTTGPRWSSTVLRSDHRPPRVEDQQDPDLAAPG
jgi:MFS family permease